MATNIKLDSINKKVMFYHYNPGLGSIEAKLWVSGGKIIGHIFGKYLIKKDISEEVFLVSENDIL